MMALAAEHGASFLSELREQMNRHNVYRGHILALANDPFGDTSIVVESMREVQRDEIVLPQGVLERVERHTIEFAREAERLRGAGRHLRRGLMLHGPPGTGKTLCSPRRSCSRTSTWSR